MVLKEQSTPFGQTSNQATIFPTHNLDFIDSVSGMEFCTQLWPSRIWCIIILVPKTWRHLYVIGVACMGIFSITDENITKLLKLEKFYRLGLETAMHFQVPLKSIIFLKSIKDARLEPKPFSNTLVKNLPQKLSYVLYLFFLHSACCHQRNCFPTYYTVGWTTNDLLLIALRFFKTHYSLQLMWLVLNPVPASNNELSFITN